MISYFIVGLLTLCMGYFLGRYQGWQEGVAEATTYAPLELKADALTKGICPICQTVFASSCNCEEVDT